MEQWSDAAGVFAGSCVVMPRSKACSLLPLLPLLLLLGAAYGRAVPCSELHRQLRYPCRCTPAEDGIAMDCDRVVFPGDLPALPYGSTVVSFSQRWAGHQSLPTQAFTAAALPLRSLDFSGNSLRRLTDR